MANERLYTPQAVALRTDERQADKREVHGLAAVFYDGTPATEYKVGKWFRERIMPTAFDQALADGDDVRALFNHDPNLILGRISARTLTLKKVDKGLQYTVDLPDTTAGRDLVESVSRRDVQGSSFAFDVLEDQWFEDKGTEVDVREVHSVRLFDVSPVTFPAYDSTTVTVRADLEQHQALMTSWRLWRSRQGENEQMLAIRLFQLRARAVQVEVDSQPPLA